MAGGDDIKPDAAPAVVYFGIGAQKAGTSWLYEYLAGHPDVANGPLKEYHYFSHFHRRLKTGAGRPAFFGLRRRLALASVLRRARPELSHLDAFRAARAGTKQFLSLIRGEINLARIYGDITPVYSLLDRTAFAEMRDCASDVRFIFIMRDPVGRLWSQVRMRARSKGISPQVDNPSFAKLINKCSVDAEYLGRSDYARTITELEAVIPAERIHYMFYEEMFTPEAIAALTSFLGVANKPADFGKYVHQGVAADMPEAWRYDARQRLDKVYRFVANKFSGRVPLSWDQGSPDDDSALNAGNIQVDKITKRARHAKEPETKPIRRQSCAAFELAEV